MNHLKTELRWLLCFLLLPFAILIGFDLVMVQSPLSVWNRLFTLEDCCPYGYCFVLPPLIYAFSLIMKWRWGVLKQAQRAPLANPQ